MLKKGQYRRAEKLLYILRDLNWGSFIVHKMYIIAATRNFGKHGLRFRSEHDVVLMSYLVEEEIGYLKKTGTDKYKESAERILLRAEKYYRLLGEMKKYAKYFVR